MSMNDIFQTIVAAFLIFAGILAIEGLVVHVGNRFPTRSLKLTSNSDETKKHRTHLIGPNEMAEAERISKTPVVELIPKNATEFEQRLDFMAKLHKDRNFKFSIALIGAFIRSTESCFSGSVEEATEKVEAARPVTEKDMNKLRYELTILVSAHPEASIGNIVLETLNSLFSRYINDTANGTIEEKNRKVFSPINGDEAPLFNQIEKTFEDAGKAGLLSIYKDPERVENVRFLIATVRKSHVDYNRSIGEKVRAESELRAVRSTISKKSDLMSLIDKDKQKEDSSLSMLVNVEKTSSDK